MNRWIAPAVVLLFSTRLFATTTSHHEPQIVIDDGSHFVLLGDQIALLGLQLESRSGSLLPDTTGDTGPFQFQMANSPSVVMFGSLGTTVQVSGSLTLPTRWNPAGQRDVGFLWGTESDQGRGAVEGHSPTFISDEPFSSHEPDGATEPPVQDLPNGEETTSGNVGGILVPNLEEHPDAATIAGRGLITLYANDNELFLNLWEQPSFASLTVKSSAGLLSVADSILPSTHYHIRKQDEFAVTLVPVADTPDGDYPLGLKWTGGSDYDDLALAFESAAETPVPFAEIVSLESRALPEPSAGVMLLTCTPLMVVLRRFHWKRHADTIGRTRE